MYKAWICRIELQPLKIIINEKYNDKETCRTGNT